jgi:hypothetical protein
MSSFQPTPEVPEPKPVAELDEQLRHTVKTFHRLRWYGVAALAAVVLIALIVGGLLLTRQQMEITADCAAIREIALLQPETTPPAKAPSQLIVTYIINNRNSYIGKGCGSLPPPSGKLTHWARFYGLPVRS